MAIAVEEVEVTGGTGVKSAESAAFVTQPTAGWFWAVFGSGRSDDGSADLTLSAPAGLTYRQNGWAVGNLAARYADKSSSGSDGTTSTVSKSGTQRQLGIAAIALSGVSAFDTSGASVRVIGAPVSATTTANVAANNSLAVAVVTRVAGTAAITYSVTSGWTEQAKIQTTTDNTIEVYVYTKAVATAGSTESFTWERTDATDTKSKRCQIGVYSPSASVAPTVSMDSPPGAMDILEGDVINLEASATGGATPYKNWSWSVVEGSSGTTPVTTQNGTMAFPNEGTWTLRLTVDGDDDLTSTAVDQTITVTAVPVADSVGAVWLRRRRRKGS